MAIYIKFTGERPVPGGATAPGYGGWFEALAYQSSMGSPSRRESSGGATTTIDVTLTLDTYALPLLYGTCEFQKVVLHVVGKGNPPKLILEMTLTNVYAASSGGSGSQVVLTLHPAQISLHYYQYDPLTGKEMTPKAGYDIKQVMAQ